MAKLTVIRHDADPTDQIDLDAWADTLVTIARRILARRAEADATQQRAS